MKSHPQAVDGGAAPHQHRDTSRESDGASGSESVRPSSRLPTRERGTKRNRILLPGGNCPVNAAR